MSTIAQYTASPTMVVNGNVQSVSIHTWANIALSGEDLTNYITAQQNQDTLFQTLLANNSIVVEDVFKWNDTGNVVIGNITYANVWSDTGNIVVGTIGSTTIQENNETLVLTTVNGVVANVIVNCYMLDGKPIIPPSSINLFATNIKYPANVQTVNSEWVSYWDRFLSDPNVTFPTGWNTISNV